MRYKIKRRIRRIAFVAIIALALIAALVFIIYRATHPVAPVNKRTVRLPAASAEHVTGWESGFLCVDDRTLTCVDTQGEALWEAELPQAGMRVTRAYDMTAAWTDRQYVLYDSGGALVATRETENDILMLRCGSSNVALLTQEEDQHRLWVYDFKGQVVDEARFPYLSVMEMAYYGAGKQLWVLVLDSHGTLPVSWYRSYHPGESTTGAITLNGQAAYSALPTDKETFVVGTHNLIGHKASDSNDYKKLIYGWSLQDQRRTGDQASFLLAPSNTGDQDAALSTLWYIAVRGEEYRIPLPSGCFRALFGGPGITAVTREGVYTMQVDGGKRTFSKMPFLIDRVAAVSPGQAMAVESGGAVYLVPLT